MAEPTGHCGSRPLGIAAAPRHAVARERGAGVGQPGSRGGSAGFASGILSGRSSGRAPSRPGVSRGAPLAARRVGRARGRVPARGSAGAGRRHLRRLPPRRRAPRLEGSSGPLAALPEALVRRARRARCRRLPKARPPDPDRRPAASPRARRLACLGLGSRPGAAPHRRAAAPRRVRRRDRESCAPLLRHGAGDASPGGPGVARSLRRGRPRLLAYGSGQRRRRQSPATGVPLHRRPSAAGSMAAGRDVRTAAGRLPAEAQPRLAHGRGLDRRHGAARARRVGRATPGPARPRRRTTSGACRDTGSRASCCAG